VKLEYDILIEKLEKEINPTIRAAILGKYLSDCLKTNSFNLYEAYLINWEKIRFERRGYLQSSWNERVGITNCISVLNMKMLAYLFNEEKSLETLDNWAKEAYRLNQEKRKHYIMDQYEKYLGFNKNIEVLRELLKIRENKRKPFNDGPYHTEIFPYEYCKPEELIIDHNLLSEKHIDESIENLLVKIYLLND